ncbi:hypothetical protein DFQ27_005519 [Actinomortierella ambigua]|uniref:MYND-type domain-containing protein n=1 Tax=Actinomortierella ambigua TaxID=1343610 RepID=A0A9P6U2G1_9FUNG|nr:hypothetical protein DFQ26_002476 [Actinomortierella ambigua]KAG0256739.1 hypothetical protein DFQ27_005519 [Actinomortierella ambigua]
MVRHEQIYGALNVAWGYDDALRGYFLTISDNRLAWQQGQSDEMTKICEQVSEDGAGRYFDLNTYPVGGFGYRVSEATMFTFMRRYGIDPAKIGTPGAVKIDDDVKRCANPKCRTRGKSTMRCTGCRFAWYCTRACQLADWNEHKKANNENNNPINYNCHRYR